MRILAIGDVCGSIGCNTVRNILPKLKKEKDINFVVINGENSADGNGITPSSAQALFSCGMLSELPLYSVLVILPFSIVSTKRKTVEPSLLTS